MASKAEDKVDETDIEKDDLAALNGLEMEEREFKKDAEIDRILKTFKLDAYAVLDIQPGVPDSDIVKVYRKKSLLIHPDKTKNPSAPAAFDTLNKAYTLLTDEKQRARLDEAITDARTLLMRERKLTVDSEEIRHMDEEMKAAWRQKTVEVLVDNEQRRRRQLKAQMREEGREQMKQEKEVEERKRKRDHQQAWEETRDTRVSTWRDFQKGKKDKEDGKKKKKMKVLG